MRCPEKSINTKYISKLKNIYLMFLKYKQTQPVCAKNEHVRLYPELVFNWNQANIGILDVHSSCLFYYCTITFIL